jgi:hypothetical protein
LRASSKASVKLIAKALLAQQLQSIAINKKRSKRNGMQNTISLVKPTEDLTDSGDGKEVSLPLLFSFFQIGRTPGTSLYLVRQRAIIAKFYSYYA